MKEAAFEIRKEYECGVLVVGGGVAGIAAAVCAARGGADVLLCESGGFLGGTATKGLVGPFMTCYDAKGEKQIIRGFFSELVGRMTAAGGAVSPADCPGGDSRSGYREKGHIGVTPFDAECLKSTAEQMCREASVRLRYHAMLIGCECDGARVKTAYFAGVEGVFAVSAKVFIDATGNASLAHFSGAETFRGDETGFVQTASLFFRITGVDKEMLDLYMAEHTEMRSRYYMDEIEAARLRGEFPCGTRKLRIFEGPGDIWTVNMAQEDEPVNDLDGDCTTEAEIRQRAQIPQLIAFMRKTIPALRNIRLLDSASDIGIRETRRMVGRTLFTGEDIAACRHFDDQIAVCANSVDIHRPDKVSYSPYQNEGSYTIPLSCLISRDRVNLMAAGKCLSADAAAHAAVRVMPPCMAMGEAVGITAALAVRLGSTPQEVSVSQVQRLIRENGGYLE